MSLNIVLVEPEIPHNTGNIARTCALTNTELHLVKPLGFSVEDKYLKRAGLDYWNLLKIHYYNNFAEVVNKYSYGNFYYGTTKAKNNYTDFKYKDNSFFVFGKETKGLPEDLIYSNIDHTIKIPMKSKIGRSLNLSNSVNIILYEALRQLNFPLLE
ncbi:MAG TPA: tRNA (cytidine(34)-2'-O)-methyltransferase [Tissierellaceae bacterium]|nr:tRNA (cytidine(34)-2'-O)-methyltransferase [Tissierellaceae bacterium]